MYSRVLVATFVVLGCGSSTEEPSDSTGVVYTNSGPVTGLTSKLGDGKVDAFLGIPYAQPPVGRRRFAKPEPIKPWTNVLRAVEKHAGCVQTDAPVYKEAKLNMSKTTEDCLYLNIWVPRRDCSDSPGTCAQPLPVFVYIHGGLFIWGSSAMQLYDGLRFAARARMIYVSFNYRVGVLGFLNSSTPTLPGNMGLYDQLEALRWINKNIGFFGGDSDAITLAGQSAGAISTSYHAMSELSRGLFQRAVLFSGTPHLSAYADSTDQRENFIIVSRSVDCWNDSIRLADQISDALDCLRKLDAHKLTSSATKALSFRMITMIPGYGDSFLLHNPLNPDYSALHVSDIFIGTTKDDGAFLVAQLLSHARWLGDEIDGPTTFRFFLRNFMKVDHSETAQFSREYFADVGLHGQLETKKNLSVAVTDGGFECSTDFFVRTAIRQGINVFRYVFEHRPSYSFWPAWITATHADELLYFLGTIHSSKSELTAGHGRELEWLLRNFRPSPDELQFSDDLIDLVATFCKTG
ncbi:unnamed protein product [Ixodes pacificus]